MSIEGSISRERIGILGGSFNPPTIAHLMLAEHIAGRYADQVMFMPVGDLYEKSGLVTSVHRLKMLELAIGSNPRFSLSVLEAEQSGRGYTIDTLRALQKTYPYAELLFMVGSDHLAGLPYWYKIVELLSEFKILLLTRAEDNPTDEINANTMLKRYSDRIIIISDHPRSNLSSAAIREKIKLGESIRYLTENSVMHYIHEHGLYMQD